MNYIIRKLRQEEVKILDTFLHEAIFIPEGVEAPPMRDFDNRVGKWCKDRNNTYTRYCDDMTFSGNINTAELKSFIKKELFKEGFFLNSRKTVVASKGQRMSVTGLVVNEKLSIPRDYKKRFVKIFITANDMV